MKNKLSLIVLVIVFVANTHAQKKNSSSKDSCIIRTYPIIIADFPNSFFTMHQFNQNYLSAYRYLSTESLIKFDAKKTFFIQLLATIITTPLTHEEGHRSILTSEGIGAISNPIINEKGAAYVTGVTDATLKSMRQNHLPSYIRLHTAGLESDYMLNKKTEDIVFFGQESKAILINDFLIRQFSLTLYYGLSPFSKIFPKLKEEENELNRDIVGHDVYGVVKNLFRPNDQFYRYTNYEDLTTSEQKFVTRTAVRSLLNFATPMFFKQLNVINKDYFKMYVGTGYTMSPFGDFIDEIIWAKINKKINLKIYLRQSENRNTWFMGGGLSLIDYQISPKLSTTVSAHLWSQPKNLDFNTTESQVGGSGDLLLKYVVLENKSHNSLSIDLGLNYKTAGFLPEEVIMKEHFGVRLGVTVNLVRNILLKKE